MPVLKSRRSGGDLRKVAGYFATGSKPRVVKRKLTTEERLKRLERRVEQLELETSTRRD